MRRVIEIMWLAISAISLVEVYFGYKAGGFKNENFQLFAIIFVAATFMYFLRKRQRSAIEKHKKGL